MSSGTGTRRAIRSLRALCACGRAISPKSPALAAARRLERHAGRAGRVDRGGDNAQINVSGFASLFYGYFFWLGRSLVGRREVQWMAAVGLGGQRVFIAPALDLVVAAKSSLQLTARAHILNRHVLKAVD